MGNRISPVELFESTEPSGSEENAAVVMAAFARDVLVPLFGVEATLNACLSGYAAIIAYCNYCPKDGAEALRAQAGSLPDVVAAIRLYNAAAANDADHPS
jgi:hypothetical protein